MPVDGTAFIAIIGVVSALVAVIAKMMSNIIEVIKSNTEANAQLAHGVATLAQEMTNHAQDVDVALSEFRPAIALQKDILTTLSTVVNQNEKVTGNLAQISLHLEKMAVAQLDILTALHLVKKKKRRNQNEQ